MSGGPHLRAPHAVRVLCALRLQVYHAVEKWRQLKPADQEAVENLKAADATKRKQARHTSCASLRARSFVALLCAARPACRPFRLAR